MKDIQPILVSSPVRRAGTTLVQRLLCSADNCLIYGESCAHDLNYFIQMYITKALNYGSSSNFRDDMLNEVLKGNVNDWIADLAPPIVDYVEGFRKSSIVFLDYLEEYANKQNRPIWGLKMAEWNSQQIIHVQKNFTGSKLVYILRNLEDCVRSAKTVGILNQPPEVEQFSQIWKQNKEGILENYPKDQLLLVDYKKLVQDPAAIIGDLENFTGAKGIKIEVMQQKINTYKFDERVEKDAKIGYLKPVELSAEELEIIEKYDS